MKTYTLLYVDDEAPNLRALERNFRYDYEVLTAGGGAEALEILRSRDVHLLLTDQRMPGMTGLELLQEAIRIRPSAVRMILTAFTDNEVLLKAIHEGKVFDYILKPWRRETLALSLQNAVAFYQSQVERLRKIQLRAENAESELERLAPPDLVGGEGGLRPFFEKLAKIAPTDSTVLIRGESGTGKELIARALHRQSRRREEAFVKVNASAFSAGVLESELFGHEKGAFTGAAQRKIGRFELADGGTLFLDEVGDLPEAVQIKLLRVLQEREFERVGGLETVQVDVRLVAATHRPLELLVEEGKFREDLFYRLHVIPLEVPPLRERKEDIPALAKFFLAGFNREMGKSVRLTEPSLAALQAHSWPGNVRELRNAVERAVALADAEAELTGEDLAPPTLRETAPETLSDWAPDKPLRAQLRDEEMQRAAEALRKARGNLTEAARLLGLPRTTLFSRLKKWGLA